MILLDTNVLLEFLLGQEKKLDCKRLLEMASSGSLEATVTHFSVHAVEAILGGGEDLAAFLANLERSTGLYVYETTISDEIAAALLAVRIKRDFDDALQYYVAKKIGAEKIVSLDRHFDGLDVERIEPSELTR